MNSPEKKMLFAAQAALLFAIAGGLGMQDVVATPHETQVVASDKKAAASDRSSGSVVDDSVITAKVKSALVADDEVKAFDINVKTRKGEVVLSGMVENENQISRAVQIASNVDGVRTVSNRLSVKK